MAKILDNNELRLLPTKKIYDQLDNGTDGCEDEMFYTAAKAKLGDYNWFHNVSDKILKGLCYAHRNNFQEVSDNDICIFLFYWLGDILYDNLNPWFHFNSVISNLFLILRNFSGKKCTAPTYYNIYKGEDFKNMKLFFDYSKDYDTYQQHITDNRTCNEKYNDYLQKHVETYKKFQSECEIKPHSPGYCKAFNEYFHVKGPERLSNLTCNIQNNEPETKQAHDEIEATQELQIQAHGTGEESVILTGGLERGTEQGSERHGSLGNPPQAVNFPMAISSDPADVPSISGTTKTIATTASVAGILVPPFLVYNFTPVRSWINKLLGRKPIYRNPLTERELIENSYQHHHFDSERNRYNISYRPE
ncbi:PIR protein [Plasmodium vivax]|uniref:VIR protein n=1 Tax=Plasmodium vivax TaxID=5855 RepID=A0A565A1X4_PLAVI|nr:PIR protein [Plasmodium vivax]